MESNNEFENVFQNFQHEIAQIQDNLTMFDEIVSKINFKLNFEKFYINLNFSKF